MSLHRRIFGVLFWLHCIWLEAIGVLDENNTSMSWGIPFLDFDTHLLLYL